MMHLDSPGCASTQRLAPILGLGLGLCVAFGGLDSLEARDADGERLGARLHEVGTTHGDDLTSSEDGSDWSYFKLEDQREVTVTLEVQKTDGQVELRLVGGTGNELVSRRTRGEDVSIQKTLNAGLYYVEVSADADASYQLDIE